MVLTATLCFHFALSANLWFKPALDAWSGCIDLKGVIAEQLPTYGSKCCHFMAQVSAAAGGQLPLAVSLPSNQRGRIASRDGNFLEAAFRCLSGGPH